MESDNKCRAKHRITHEQICTRDIWDHENQLCIFHSSEKPTDEFKRRFEQEVKQIDPNDKFNGHQFTFPSQLMLEDMTFKTEVNFDGANFGDNVSFGESTVFEQRTTFRNAKFGNRVSFKNVKFKGNVNFQNVEFGEWASFDGTHFENWVVFNIVRFSNCPSFRNAHFEFKSSFEGDTVLGDEASFIFAEFGDEVFFSKDVKFDGSANFRRATFQGGVRFNKMQSNGILDLRNVIFEKPSQVNLHELNLGRILLAGSNVQDINFQECSWPKVDGRPQVGDEIEFVASDPRTGTLEVIELLYLQLQANFDTKKRYHIGGDFYISAMETRRKQFSSWLRRNLFSLIALYRHVSFYGERYVRSLGCMFFLVFILAFSYLPLGFDYPAADPPRGHYEPTVKYVFSSRMKISEFLKDYAKALDISFHSFTFQRAEPSFRLTNLSRIFYIAESGVSATLLALFLLAVRRRFRR